MSKTSSNWSIGPGLTSQLGPFKVHKRDFEQVQLLPWKGGGVAGGGQAHAGHGDWSQTMNPGMHGNKFGNSLPSASKYTNIVTPLDVRGIRVVKAGVGRFAKAAPTLGTPAVNVNNPVGLLAATDPAAYNQIRDTELLQKAQNEENRQIHSGLDTPRSSTSSYMSSMSDTIVKQEHMGGMLASVKEEEEDYIKQEHAPRFLEHYGQSSVTVDTSAIPPDHFSNGLLAMHMPHIEDRVDEHARFSLTADYSSTALRNAHFTRFDGRSTRSDIPNMSTKRVSVDNGGSSLVPFTEHGTTTVRRESSIKTDNIVELTREVPLPENRVMNEELSTAYYDHLMAVEAVRREQANYGNDFAEYTRTMKRSPKGPAVNRVDPYASGGKKGKRTAGKKKGLIEQSQDTTAMEKHIPARDLDMAEALNIISNPNLKRKMGETSQAEAKKRYKEGIRGGNYKFGSEAKKMTGTQVKKAHEFVTKNRLRKRIGNKLHSANPKTEQKRAMKEARESSKAKHSFKKQALLASTKALTGKGTTKAQEILRRKIIRKQVD